MAFSAATCITFNPGTQTSTGPFDIYLDSDYTSTPILTNITLQSLTPPNCPYIIENIPNGTINLGIKDTIKDYCITIPIEDNNICSNCDLGLSQYSASTISKLYCGVLTGSCQTVTDYLIDWYGPNNTTTVAITSGSGSFVTSGVYSHPFSTTTSSIPLVSGLYTPVIRKIILGGLTYSNTGGTGNILFSGDCLPSTTILPLTCNVNTNPSNNDYQLSAYTNFLSFNSSTQGTPQPVTTTYQISASTKYIVWSFEGQLISDRLKISFSGSSYGTNKIGLDDFIIGDDLPTSNFNPLSYPKSADTPSTIVKFTCLTGLTVNNGDNIIIEITPATSNTNWKLYMSCIDDYNCNDCLKTQNYKIIGSTITGNTKSCGILNVNFKISGCSYPDSSSDYISYYMANNGIVGNNVGNVAGGFSNLINLTTPDMYFTNTNCSYGANAVLSECRSDSSPTMYDKTFLPSPDGRGVYGFTGSSTFISTYYNSIRNSFLGVSPYYSNWSGSTSNTDVSYYRYFFLKIPSTTSTNSCGDGNTFITTYIHQTSPYLSGITSGGDYFLKITANTISSGITFTSCDINCTSIENSVVQLINNYSTGTTSSYGTNRVFSSGVYYTNPIYYNQYLTVSNTPYTAHTHQFGYFTTADWSFNTYPFSGTPSTIIPSLSGTVCDYTSTGVISNVYNSAYQRQFKYYYQVRLINSSSASNYEIWASPITNFSYSGAPSTALYELAYRYSGGSVTFSNPTYII
jgi:hypothetical protein